jgi:thiol:disulfide interchange protein DsbA
MKKATDKFITNQKIALGVGALVVAAIAVYLSTLVVSDIPMGTYEEGIHYQAIENPRRLDSNKIEVVEIFSYACIHCFNLDPDLEVWVEENQDKIDFVRLPAIQTESWRILARAYYATETLGILENTHLELFHAIHNKRMNLTSVEKLASFLDGKGTTAEQFTQAYNSVEVTNKVTEADRMERRYRVASIPTIIVNGKYRVTTSQQVGRSRILDVVEYLVDQEIAEKSNKNQGD